MNVIFFGNLLIILVIIYFIACIIERYNELVFDRFRFKYFALRDRLAMLVIDGDLDEDSWEYQEIVDAINFHIRAVESISIDKIANAINAIASYHVQEETERKYELINRETENEQVVNILIDLFEATRRLIYRNSRRQIWLLHRFFEGVGVSNSIRPELARVKTSDAALEHLKRYVDELRALSNGCFQAAQHA